MSGEYIPEVTPEMARAGALAHTYWDCHTVADTEVLARLVYGVMLAVASGQVSLDQVRSEINPKTGPAFFRQFL